MSATPVQIVDQQTTALVDAMLDTEIAPTKLIGIEAIWGPARIAAVQQRIASGVPTSQIPQHWNWNWSLKSANLQFLAYRCLGIECQGRMQGLMMVKTAGCVARLSPDAGKPLVYVDYIEVAPWNLRALSDTPRFGGIGVRLIEAAVRLSLDEGFHGRVGLHSLPQAEAFYRDTCLMVRLGADASYQDLPYYELTREKAAEFLSGGGQP
jgi:hypothetical protein